MNEEFYRSQICSMFISLCFLPCAVLYSLFYFILYSRTTGSVYPFNGTKSKTIGPSNFVAKRYNIVLRKNTLLEKNFLPWFFIFNCSMHPNLACFVTELLILFSLRKSCPLKRSRSLQERRCAYTGTSSCTCK